MIRQRRQKGEGSITEYRKGHFRACIDLGRDPQTNKRVRKTFTGATKAEVISKLNKAKYEKQEGLLTINNKTPFHLFCDHWLDLKEQSVKPSTIYNYKQIITHQLKPLLGHKSLSDISVIDLNGFFGKSNISKLSSLSRVKIKAILHNIFKLAIKEGLILRNPMELVESIKRVQKEIKPLTVDEVHRLLDTAKGFTPFYYIIKLTLETGFRRGEIFGLHWSDINFKDSTISVRRNLHNAGNMQIVGTPKTPKSRRTIYVSPATLEELKVLKREGCDIIFSSPNGTYMNLPKAYRIFKNIVSKAGLRPDIRFHDLRHTNATLLIANGVNMKTVSERLGHKSITTTLDLYTHAVQEEDKKAAQVISGIV